MNLITFTMLVIIVISIFPIPQTFYLITLQSALRSIAPENRSMPASNVWLLLIPVFGLAWHFIIVKNMADSIKAEANSADIILKDANPGYNIGVTMCILGCLNLIPVLNLATAPVFVLFWIVYWAQIASYKKTLLAVNFEFIGGKQE